MLPNRLTAAVAAAALALLAPAAAALAGDLIQKKDGTFTPSIRSETPGAQDFESSNWTVADADMDELVYQIPLNNKLITQKMKSSDVAEIWLDPSRYKADWKDAAEALNSGDYARARAAFRAIGDDRKAHPVVRQKALLNSMRAVAAANNTKEVDAAGEYLFQVFPKSFYTKAALKDLSGFWMDQNNIERALEYVGRLLKLPGVSESDRLEARLLQNTVAFRKAAAGKDAPGIQRCLDEYKAIAQECAGKKDLAGVQRAARLGTANALLETGGVKEAKGLFEEIAETGKENAVIAAAFNGLGECWFRQNNTEGWFEARLCFLRTVVQFAEGTPPDQVARALYFAGECFYRLQDTEDWKASAQRELNECIRRFPQSPWAEKSRRLVLNVK